MPYLSLMLYLVFSGMLFLCSMTVIFALISPFKDKPDEALVIDMCALVALAVLITVFHVIYAVVFLNNTNKLVQVALQYDIFNFRVSEQVNEIIFLRFLKFL